jgi:hypothetical protein
MEDKESAILLFCPELHATYKFTEKKKIAITHHAGPVRIDGC